MLRQLPLKLAYSLGYCHTEDVNIPQRLFYETVRNTN